MHQHFYSNVLFLGIIIILEVKFKIDKQSNGILYEEKQMQNYINIYIFEECPRGYI